MLAQPNTMFNHLYSCWIGISRHGTFRQSLASVSDCERIVELLENGLTRFHYLSTILFTLCLIQPPYHV